MFLYKGWTAAVWTGKMKLHTSTVHTSYFRRVSSKSNAVRCRSELTNRSYIVLSATAELQSLQNTECCFHLFLCCLFHSNDVKDQSLWILINWFVTWGNLRFLFFVLQALVQKSKVSCSESQTFHHFQLCGNLWSQKSWMLPLRRKVDKSTSLLSLSSDDSWKAFPLAKTAIWDRCMITGTQCRHGGHSL